MSKEYSEICWQLEVVEEKLERASCLLLCFYEFLNDEGFIPQNACDAERMRRAECFIGRLESHLPLLTCAADIVDSQRAALLQAIGADV